MTASLLPNGKQQFIDINGKPLVAGTVGMYVAGTLIPKDTWQNSIQTILNTNPIILDSRGQAIIYGTGVYRQIVKDAQGNLIWDQLVASQEPDALFVTPEQFGAVGDGSTDDIAAFIAALTFLSAQPHGGTLVLGPKYYANSAEIVLGTSNISVLGQGSGSSALIPLTNGQNVIRFAASNCQARGFGIINSFNKTTVRGLVLGPATSVTLTTNNNLITDIMYHGLQYGRVMAPGTTPSQCYFNNFIGEEFVSCSVGILHDNPLTAGNGGANANNTLGFSVWSDSTISNTGIIIKAGANNNFTNGYIEGMNNPGVLATPTAIQILHASSDGADNNSNKFYGVSGETNTIGYDNSNALTQIYGGNLNTGSNTFTAIPVIIASDDPSEVPFVFPGLKYQTNNQLAGVPNSTSWFDGVNGAATATGPMVSATYFATKTGLSNGVVNGGTFNITIPLAGVVYELCITDNTNFNQPYMSMFGTDGIGATTFTVIAAGNVTVTGTAFTITVTNASGSTANISWSLMQRTKQ